MKKIFYVMLTTTILTTPPLFAMDQPEDDRSKKAAIALTRPFMNTSRAHELTVEGLITWVGRGVQLDSINWSVEVRDVPFMLDVYLNDEELKKLNEDTNVVFNTEVRVCQQRKGDFPEIYDPKKHTASPMHDNGLNHVYFAGKVSESIVAFVKYPMNDAFYFLRGEEIPEYLKRNDKKELDETGITEEIEFKNFARSEKAGDDQKKMAHIRKARKQVLFMDPKQTHKVSDSQLVNFGLVVDDQREKGYVEWSVEVGHSGDRGDSPFGVSVYKNVAAFENFLKSADPMLYCTAIKTQSPYTWLPHHFDLQYYRVFEASFTPDKTEIAAVIVINKENARRYVNGEINAPELKISMPSVETLTAQMMRRAF